MEQPNGHERPILFPQNLVGQSTGAGDRLGSQAFRQVRQVGQLDQPEPPQSHHPLSTGFRDAVVEMVTDRGPPARASRSNLSGPSILMALRRTMTVERDIRSAIEEPAGCLAPCHPGS